jgi:hypothetical protein
MGNFFEDLWSDVTDIIQPAADVFNSALSTGVREVLNPVAKILNSVPGLPNVASTLFPPLLVLANPGTLPVLKALEDLGEGRSVSGDLAQIGKVTASAFGQALGAWAFGAPDLSTLLPNMTGAGGSMSWIDDVLGIAGDVGGGLLDTILGGTKQANPIDTSRWTGGIIGNAPGQLQVESVNTPSTYPLSTIAPGGSLLPALPVVSGFGGGGRGGGRALIPYSGGMVERGTHVVYRPARRPTPGHAEGYFTTRSRRMNPLNIRALNRALHRTHSATRLVKRLFSLPKSTIRKKHFGRKKK